MKTALLLTVAGLLAATTLAAPVSAATPAERRLARQVKLLQRQVKSLQRSVTTLRQQMAGNRPSAPLSLAAAATVYGACLTTATADAFQGTWEAIDRDSAPPDLFRPQTPLADPINSCQRLEVQRFANPQAEPTTDVFAALLNLFR